MRWVYFTKDKDELTGYYTVREFILERESEGKSVKGMKLRSDNGTEYKNSSINDFLLEKNVRQEFTATDSPETNGLVQRCIAIDVTRAMATMSHAGLLKSYPELLEEAIRHSVHLNERAMKAECGQELMQEPVFGSVM